MKILNLTELKIINLNQKIIILQNKLDVMNPFNHNQQTIVRILSAIKHIEHNLQLLKNGKKEDDMCDDVFSLCVWGKDYNENLIWVNQ